MIEVNPDSNSLSNYAENDDSKTTNTSASEDYEEFNT